MAAAVLLIRLAWPRLTGPYLDILSGSVLLVLLALVVFRKWRAFFTTFFILAVIIVTIFVFKQRSPERGATYLIVDASENMRGLFQDMGPRINLTAKGVPDSVEVGLMVFGGGISTSAGCDDIVPLVEPAPKQTSIPEIEKTVEQLTRLQPEGPGTLQRAILQALNELAGRSGVQRIIVITSGSDTRCSVLDRAVLEIAADQKNVQFELTIITVGPQSQETREQLARQAHKYISLASIEEVPETVETIVSEPIRRFYGPYHDQ